MQLVETILRPARIAWILPCEPSATAANRTFRLATSRWGGRYDVILQHDVGEPLSDFVASALVLADPDFLLSVDRALGRHDWDPEFARLRIQPFDTGHLPTGNAELSEWGGLLRGRPTAGSDDDEASCRAEMGAAFDWRFAAERGLLGARSKPSSRVRDDDAVPTALEVSSEGLTQRGSSIGAWILLGDRNVMLACRYWTLRALGARVAWRSLGWLGPGRQISGRDRGRLALAYVSAPALSRDELSARLQAQKVRRSRIAIDDLRTCVDSDPEGPEYARQVLAVAPHRDRVHFSLPAPDTGGRPLSSLVSVVVEHRLRSLDPMSPDGIMLGSDPVTRGLLRRGEAHADLRVTKRGLAAQQRLGETSLQSVPVIGFREAVAAPLQAAGYRVELSDKGRFQTKALEQARGLRFLAWVLCQTESRHLLAIFDEHHLPGCKIKESYRRSVTYEDLRERLWIQLRAGGRRMTGPRREAGDSWLKRWADQLLDRGLLVGGYHLKCSECLFGDFYAAERTDARFRCDRCNAMNVVPGDAGRRLRLGELFDTLRRQHGDVVTLVLSWLRQEAEESLLYLPEIDLFRDGERVGEADFAALVDGRLALGEAKSARTITKKEIDKLATAARLSGASRLIFATLDDDPACGTPACAGCVEDGEPDPDHAWTEGTRRHIRGVRQSFGRLGIQVVSLRRAELLDMPGMRLGELANSTRAFDTPRGSGRTGATAR